MSYNPEIREKILKELEEPVGGSELMHKLEYHPYWNKNGISSGILRSTFWDMIDFGEIELTSERKVRKT